MEIETEVYGKHVVIPVTVEATLSRPYSYSGDYGSSGEMVDIERLRIYARNGRDITKYVPSDQREGIEDMIVDEA